VTPVKGMTPFRGPIAIPNSGAATGRTVAGPATTSSLRGTGEGSGDGRLGPAAHGGSAPVPKPADRPAAGGPRTGPPASLFTRVTTVSVSLDRLDRPTRRPDLYWARTPGRLLRHRGSQADFAAGLGSLARPARRTPAGCRRATADAFALITDARTLRAAFDHQRDIGGPGPGPDGVRLAAYAEEYVWPYLRGLRNSLRGPDRFPPRPAGEFPGDYYPGPDRRVEVPKGPGRGVRVLHIPNAEDRVVQRAVASVLAPPADHLFADTSYAYRPGRSTQHALAAVYRRPDAADTLTWVSADIANAFDRVPLGPVMDVVAAVVGDPRAVELVRRLLCRGRGRKLPKRGLGQGGPLSPFLLNLLLHFRLDRPWATAIKKAGVPARPLFRYSDDLLVPCRDAAEAAAARGVITALLHPLGLGLKGGAGDGVSDLAAGAAVPWLGYEVRRTGGRFVAGIAGDAWAGLAASLADAAGGPDPRPAAGRVVVGWLGYLGPCFADADRPAVLARVGALAARAGVGWEADGIAAAAWAGAARGWRRMLAAPARPRRRTRP